MGKVIFTCRQHKKIARAMMESEQEDLGLGLDGRIVRVLHAYPESNCDICTSTAE